MFMLFKIIFLFLIIFLIMPILFFCLVGFFGEYFYLSVNKDSWLAHTKIKWLNKIININKY